MIDRPTDVELLIIDLMRAPSEAISDNIDAMTAEQKEAVLAGLREMQAKLKSVKLLLRKWPWD